MKDMDLKLDSFQRTYECFSRERSDEESAFAGEGQKKQSHRRRGRSKHGSYVPQASWSSVLAAALIQRACSRPLQKLQYSATASKLA